MMAEKRQTVADVLAKFHRTSDFRIGPIDQVAEAVEAISTGNLAIDHITGVGGLPRGRSVELYGAPSCGKTTLALQTAARAQQAGMKVLYLDYEQALDREYAERLGLDLSSELFLFGQPDSLEDGMNIARPLIATGEIGVVIFDSVAAMTPAVQLEAETGKPMVGVQARLMSEALKQLNSVLRETKTTAIFLNHVQDVIEMGGGGRPGVKRTTTPGGRALKFYASLRLEFASIKSIRGPLHDGLTNTDEEVVLGSNVRVKVIKNKVAPPFRSAVVRVRFGRGFSDAWSALAVLLAHKGVVKGGGGWFFFDRLPLDVFDELPRSGPSSRPALRGETAVLTYADEHPQWEKRLVAVAREVLAAGQPTHAAVDPDELDDDEGEEDHHD